MNKVEKIYKDKMSSLLNIDDCYAQVTKRIDFNEEKETKRMKKVLIPISLTAIAAVAVAVVTFNLLPGKATPEAIVSVDVNPSIDLVVDSNNKVISVTGNNEEGKMIVADEDIVGKDVEEAVEIIINIESDTGYLVQGSVATDENKVTISVSADTDAIKKAIEDSVTTAVNQACEQLNITATTVINEVEKYSREALEQKAMACDSTLTEEQVKEMTYDQLLSVINLHYLETAEIWSAELEKLYTEAKENKINLVENEYVQTAIDEVNVIYQAILQAYDSICDTLESKITELEELRYDTFVDPESDYQKKLAELNDAKLELLTLKNEAASTETPNEDVIALVELKEKALDAITKALETIGNFANTSIENMKTTLDSVLAQLKSAREKFPSEITEVLNAKVGELETSINNTKDNFFNEFETKYAEDINRIKEEVANRKQALKDSIAAENK